MKLYNIIIVFKFILVSKLNFRQTRLIKYKILYLYFFFKKKAQIFKAYFFIFKIL